MSMGELKLDTEKYGDDLAVIGLEGFIDADTSPFMRREFKAIYRQGIMRVVLDCSKVNYVSSQGVAVMVEFAADLREEGGDLCICCLQEQARIAFEHLNLLEYFRVYDSLAQVRKEFLPGGAEG